MAALLTLLSIIYLPNENFPIFSKVVFPLTTVLYAFIAAAECRVDDFTAALEDVELKRGVGDKVTSSAMDWGLVLLFDMNAARSLNDSPAPAVPFML